MKRGIEANLEKIQAILTMMQNCLGSHALISDLKKTFDNLDRYKLKLNPTKCSLAFPQDNF
jgi:hypothetical protein